jgi:hypothetical protein
MKSINVIPFLIALLLTACGPSKSELRAELSQIDAELMSLRIAARQHQSQMSQAEADAFIGSFAAGYGAVSGDYGLASEGAGAAYNASNQASASSYSLAQINERAGKLIKRRLVILEDLK